MFRVSILISYYNSARFISHKLSNLLSQTIRNECEFIFINGGSEEQEDNYIDQIAQVHSNFVNINTGTERISLYHAWNIGIQASCAPLLCNSNVDDVMAPNALEMLCDALDNNPDCALAYPDIMFTSKINAKWGEGKKSITTSRKVMGPLLVWRKSLHDKYGMFDERFWVLGDADFFYDRLRDEEMIKVDESLVIYWIGNNNLYRNRKLRQRDETLLELKRSRS